MAERDLHASNYINRNTLGESSSQQNIVFPTATSTHQIPTQIQTPAVNTWAPHLIHSQHSGVSLIDKPQNIIPFSTLSQFFVHSSKDAASKLNTSVSYLKKQCRAHNIQRWPYRKIAALTARIEEKRTQLQNPSLHPSQRCYLEKEISDMRIELDQIYNESFYHTGEEGLRFIDLSTQPTASSEDDYFSDDSASSVSMETPHRCSSSSPHSENKMDIHYILNTENKETKDQEFDTNLLFK